MRKDLNMETFWRNDRQNELESPLNRRSPKSEKSVFSVFCRLKRPRWRDLLEVLPLDQLYKYLMQ